MRVHDQEDGLEYWRWRVPCEQWHWQSGFLQWDVGLDEKKGVVSEVPD